MAAANTPSSNRRVENACALRVSPIITGVIGEGLVKVIEHVTHADVEQLFDHLELIAPAQAASANAILKRIPRSGWEV